MIPPDSTWSHEEFATYCERELAGLVDIAITPLMPHGLFGVPRQFFPYIEYLSGLVYGPDHAKNKLATTDLARRFLEDWMGQIDPGYRHRSQHLIEMFRHGLIHTFKPKVLSHPSSKRLLGWFSYPGPRSVSAAKYGPLDFDAPFKHLEIIVNPNRELDWLPLSIVCLIDDLKSVLKLLASELRKQKSTGGSLLKNMQAAAEFLEQPTPTKHAW